MASEQRNPSLSANDGSVGTVAWSTRNNIFLSDDARATATLDALTGVSNALIAFSFGFVIPDDATINGIELRIERSRSVVTTMRDNTVRLVKAGAAAGDDKADLLTDYPGVDAVAVYGDPGALWGTTWTPAQINAQGTGGFGGAISCKNIGAAQSTVRVDHMPITVYYTEAATEVRKAATRTINRQAVHRASLW